MDWFSMLCLMWRIVCFCAKVVGVIRATAWLRDQLSNND